MQTPSTESEFQVLAAQALRDRDALALEDLLLAAEDWMEDDDTKNARRYMLRKMAEAARLLEGEPSDDEESN